MKNVMHCMLSVVCSAVLVSPSWAVGGAAIGNEVPSARAAGQGYVGVAGQSDDPTVLYLNPAGLTQLKGTNATIGVTWENLHGQYQDNSDRVTKMRSIDVGVPNVAATQSFLDGRLGTGISVDSPYGLETHWPGNSPLRYVATNSRLNMVDTSFGAAYQVVNGFSIGGGADYFDLFNAQLQKHVNVNNINGSPAVVNVFGPPTSLASDADSQLSGTASNWGYHVGLLYQPTEEHSLGITYHSRVKLNVNGSVQITGLSGAAATIFGGSNYATSAYTDIYIPDNIQFGYAFRPNAKWLFEADTSWVDWSVNRDENIRYSETNPSRLALLTNQGQGNPTPLNWSNTWNFATGVNYTANEKLQLRGGFWYLPNSAPDSTFSPSLMDLSRIGISAGVGYNIMSALTLDFAYNAVFTHSRSISNNIGLNGTGDPSTNFDGTYKNFANLVAVNITYRYGR
jgi:long-chain fatty acid transport protein